MEFQSVLCITGTRARMNHAMLLHFDFFLIFFLHCVGFSRAYSIRLILVKSTLNIYYTVNLWYTSFRCQKQ